MDDKSIYDDNGVLREKDEEQINKDPVPESEITDEKAAASEGEKENGQQPGTEWTGVADGFTEMSESGAVEEITDERIGHTADASGSEACPANDVAFSGTKGKSVTKKEDHTALYAGSLWGFWRFVA